MDKEKTNLLFKYLWTALKFIMIPAFITNYFDVLYGGYLWILFVMFAAISKAMADTVQHHFYTSVFRGENQSFYNPIVSSAKKTVLGYRFDFWHLCNSVMIIAFAFAIVFHTEGFSWIDFCLGGYYFNVTFSLFYDKVLR